MFNVKMCNGSHEAFDKTYVRQILQITSSTEIISSRDRLYSARDTTFQTD